MHLTLGEAAKQSGLSKGTISKAISSGKLSAEKSQDTGSFKIDPSELHRYTDAVKVQRATVAKPVSVQGEERSATHSNHMETGRETLSETAYERRLAEVRERAELEARAKLAEERLSDLKAQLEDVKADREVWREQAQRLAITYQPASAPAPQRGGLFGLFKRAG